MDVKEDVYKDDDKRLQSFIGWPDDVPVSIDELARAGFYYTGSRDCVQCPWCHGRIHSWIAGDTALGEHKRHFPSCWFVAEVLRKAFQHMPNPSPPPSNSWDDVVQAVRNLYVDDTKKFSLASTPLDTNDQNLSLEELKSKIDEMHRHNTCKVCLETVVQQLFLPCRHLICCEACGNNVKFCPICRAYIAGTIKVFM